MKTLDLKRQLKAYFRPRANRVELIDVPRFRYLMLDGAIEPGVSVGKSPAFQEAFQAVYGVAFTLKFMSKLRQRNAIDYPVMAPEGLWSFPDGAFSSTGPFGWTLMMMVPEHITVPMFRAAVKQVGQKRDIPSLGRLRFEAFREGLAVQALHVGPYADEPRTIARMEAFAEERGYRFRGRHHEIYLGDPRRAKPEKLKTVLRHPVERAGR
jgi:hypothetical protein